MGVPRLFPWIIKNFPNAKIHFSEGKYFLKVDFPDNCNLLIPISDEHRLQVDNIYLDANGLLHSAAQHVFNYGGVKHKMDIYANFTHDEKIVKVYELFWQKVMRVVSIANPRKRVYIAIDGPAPLAKQAQQRQRRFVSALSSMATGNTFDPNCITPGTTFMFELTKFMHYSIRREMCNTDSILRNAEVFFSPPTVPGEGEHKCYAPDTKILMWSGEIKMIKDIEVGEYVISEEGNKRKVISLVSGVSKMYLIEQKNGDSYTVTDDHIMCFDVADHCRKYYSAKENAWILGYFDRETNTYKRKQFSGNEKTSKKKCDEFLSHIDPDSKINIKLSDYLNMSKRTQNLMYCYKCIGVNWPVQKITLDPYILGTWLGDGQSSGQGFSSIDNEIINAWERYAESVNCQVNVSKSNNIVYNVSGKSKGKGRNYILSSLQNYDLIDNKHIPFEYICNSRENRLQLLAGLIDTDGNLTHKGRMIRFNQGPANYYLFDQVVTLARSLGFKCCVREAETSYTLNDEKKYSTAKFLTISGHIEDIPTKIPRKKCVHLKAKINIDRLRTAVTVTLVGKGEYVGINVTGNRKFLLADCTIVHNCLDFMRGLDDDSKNNESHCMFGPDGDLIMLTLTAHLPHMHLLREDQYNVGYYDLLDMGSIRDGLVEIFKHTKSVESGLRTVDEVVDDFVLIGFFVGNDFLPKLQMYTYLEDGLDLMISLYTRLSKGGEAPLTTNQAFTPILLAIVENIATREKNYLHAQASMKITDPRFIDKTLMKHIQMPNGAGNGANVETKFDFINFRVDYYKKSRIDDAGPFGDPSGAVRKMCLDYLKSICWVFLYYVKGIPSWSHYYSWYYAPLMTDFCQVLSTITPEEGKFVSEFDLGEPSLPFVQLLSVISPKNVWLLPESFHWLMTSNESQLVSTGYYPESFIIDYEGKTKEHMGVALLPFIDVTLVKKLYKPVADKLTVAYTRNSRGSLEKFEYDGTYLADYFSDYGNIRNINIRKTTTL